MKSKLLSSFASGLIVATSVSGIAYFLDKTEVKTIRQEITPSEEEMKESLTSLGYLILTQEEWDVQIEATKKEVAESKPEVEKVESADETKEKAIYITMLTVTSGMTSIDVGKALEKANIINDAMDFFNEVEKRGLANDLRPGTYEVDSDMSVNEIMSTVFKQ
ncbi:hypothetical protein [Litchfieldia alkalitelluris]|uniref:hypothetical protein n=1 Tax=Litchfieldia alkalitelluris TaxID=304268 RepID=UPI0009978079|nr:hypothetical protein [Litchfieldia alkalitelluris]